MMIEKFEIPDEIWNRLTRDGKFDLRIAVHFAYCKKQNCATCLKGNYRNIGKFNDNSK
jgi:hypothetical protein